MFANIKVNDRVIVFDPHAKKKWQATRVREVKQTRFRARGCWFIKHDGTLYRKERDTWSAEHPRAYPYTKEAHIAAIAINASYRTGALIEYATMYGEIRNLPQHGLSSWRYFVDEVERINKKIQRLEYWTKKVKGMK